MQVSAANCYRGAVSILTGLIVLLICPKEAGWIFVALTAFTCAAAVLLLKRAHIALVATEIAGAAFGWYFIGFFLSNSVFATRDGSYFLQSYLPGHICGAVFGWLVAAIAVRKLRHVHM